jgi:hypothetical protein
LPGSKPLLDAQKAEVQIVLRYHGPVVPSILAKQISTGFGGCIGAGFQPPDPEPAHRLYPCYDPQATVFPSPGK